MVVNVSSRSREVDGRFAQELRTEAAELQDESMNEQGTFCFPHRHETAEELIEFFETVEVPEQVLANAVFAYTDFREHQARKEADIWSLEWQASEEYQEFKKGIAAEGKGARTLHERGNKIINEKEKEFRAQRPMTLPIFEVETIVRAAQLYSRAGNLLNEEIEKVDAHEVSFSTGTKITVKQLADRYQVSMWIRDAATVSDLQVARTSQQSADRIVAALQKLNRD